MHYRRANDADFEKIFELQNKNLLSAINPSERSDGFLATVFTIEQFREMNDALCVVVAVKGKKVCGYICTSPPDFFKKFPLQKAMLERCSQISHKNKPLSSYQTFVANPICIDKSFRGTGVYLGLCNKVLEFIPKTYQLAVGLISPENKRHLKAIWQGKMEAIDQFQFEEKTYLLFARFF